MLDVTKEFHSKLNGIPRMSDIKLGSKTYYLAPGAERHKIWKKDYYNSIIAVLGGLEQFKNLDNLIDGRKVYKYEKMDLRILLSTSATLEERIDVI